MAITAEELGLAHPRPARPALRLVHSAPSAARRPTPTVYRRRRLVAALLAAVALVVAVAVLMPRTVHATPASGPAVVVVGPGDTAWDLARVHAPAGTRVADYALAIVRHNEVAATALRPGMVLELPR